MRRAGLSDSNVSGCLAGCPSVTAGIVSKRKQLASWFLHHLIAHWYRSVMRYDSSKNSQGVTPSEGDLWEWGGFERSIFGPIRRHRGLSPKRCKIRPRLPLNTSRKPYERFRLVPRSTTLDDLELTLSGHYAFFTLHICLSEPTTKIRMNINPYYQRQKCRPKIAVSSSVRLMRIFAGVRLIFGLKWEWKLEVWSLLPSL